MIRKKLTNILPCVAFAILAFCVLLGMYPDMLYTAQDRNVFFATGSFFADRIHEPFGLMSYLGAYLTQFFYTPVVGVAILLVLWLAIYGITLRVIRRDDEDITMSHRWLALLPVSCLLWSITGVGYWIYSLTLPGYWFAHTLAYLWVVLLWWGARSTRPSRRSFWYIVGVIGSYTFIGDYVFLFAMGMLAMELSRPAKQRMGWLKLAGGSLLTIVWVLCILRFSYEEMNFVQGLKCGLPYFETNTVSSLRPSYPFILLVLFTMTLFYVHKLKMKAWLTSVATLLVLVGGVWLLGFHDYNYQAEMRMNRAAMEDDWQQIIQEEQKAQNPSRTMVMFSHIALMNTGNLGNSAFAIANSGIEINNPDSLNLNMMQIASPMVYYNYGKVQYALRWSMENTVAYGMSPYFMKLNMRCAKASGEERLYNRYKKLLSLTTMHVGWEPKPVSPLVQDLQVSFLDVIDSDHDNCERYLIENFSLAAGSSSPNVKELNLFYSMLYRDPQYFWTAFNAYYRMLKGASLPIHYQEAYLIMMENFPVKLPYEVQITPSVQQNYRSYAQAVGRLQQQGLSNDQIGPQLRSSWKHTYWWYLMYGRKTY